MVWRARELTARRSRSSSRRRGSNGSAFRVRGGRCVEPAQLADRRLGWAVFAEALTTLARLHTKGVLTRQMSGRAFLYAVAGDPRNVQAALAAHRMRRVLDSRQDRAGVLARFVADFTAEDEQVLADLLAGRIRHEGGS